MFLSIGFAVCLRAHYTLWPGNPRTTIYNDWQLPLYLPYPGTAAPSFVGENFFCESGNSGPYESKWYLDDPLWDSQGCASGSTCCDRGGPWFTTTLSEEVSDDIEVRWRTSANGEESGLELLTQLFKHCLVSLARIIYNIMHVM